MRAERAARRAEAATQSEQFKSTLLDAVAHEFKTPLTSIKAATSEMLSSHLMPPQGQREMLKIIDQEATRLSNLVTEAIHVARIEAGELRLDRRPRSVGRLLQRVLNQMETSLDGRAVELVVGEDLPLVFADAELVQLAIRQVVDNAVKYSPPGSPIWVGARRTGEAVVIRVRNRGQGVSEVEKAKIFEKFYRGAESRQRVPDMGGLEACQLIRASSDLAIIMLTVRNREKDKVEALNAGADDYVTKPFSTPELLARIRAVLRRLPLSPEGAMQMIVLDNVEINLITRRVKVGNKEVRLTPKEFDLLQYLVTHPNVPISHTRLLQAVWGPDYGDEVEYLHVFVNQLRKKIEKNPSKPKYLLTEPWFGYCFHWPDSA